MRIPLYFEKLSMFERREEPCTVALPFPQGVLQYASDLTVWDGSAVVPSQSRITSSWPDGSIKWLLVHFLANLPANKSKQMECRTDAAAHPPQHAAVKVEAIDGVCTLYTGALMVKLCNPGEKGIFRSILSANGLQLNRAVGPIIRDENNVGYDCVIGEDGWEVLEEGPVRAVVQAKGKHEHADIGKWFDYVVRVYAYAGKPWLRLDYQIINKEKSQEQLVNALELRLEKPSSEYTSKPLTALGISNYATNIRRGQAGERLTHTITAEDLQYQGNEHIPEVLYGTFWAACSDIDAGGVSVTFYQAQQNFPKRFEVSDHGLLAGIIPDGTGYSMPQGTAKTHRMLIHFHEPSEGFDQVNVRSLQFQLPDRPVIPSAIYEQAGVMEPLHVEHKAGEVERTLVFLADYRARAYGIMHWGDAPDRAYTEQGRGKGEWVWTNNEYDLPHSMMHMYARKGDRRFLDYLLTAAEHWLDVDICHYSDDPLRHQGQIPHSARHVTDQPAVCHSWVEGLLDYYHMTGERTALAAAIGVGDNVMRNLQLPRFQEPGGFHARESGWALRSLGALYTETGEAKWLEPISRIVDQLEEWKEKHGTWVSPYTDHTLVRVPFMIAIAANSLMRYYRIRPEERIRRMVVDAMEDLLANSYMEDEEIFYYKELPSLVRAGTMNPIILESLSYAYEFTGDLRFLKAGVATFQFLCKRIEREIVAVGAKEISGDAVLLWSGLGPKFFAQYYYPLFYYYRTASGAGVKL